MEKRITFITREEAMRIELDNYIKVLKEKTTIEPKVLFEAGSKTGDDAEFLAKQLGVPDSGVYVCEPHSEFYKKILEKYPQHTVMNIALFNEEGELEFNEANNLDDGRSSLMGKDIYQKDFSIIKVKAKRMDNLMEELGLETVDVFKLDVEGASYEVLESFGERIDDLKSIQIEAEYDEVWENQKTWGVIVDFMMTNDFVLLWEHNIINIQVDSVWVKKEFIK